MVLTVGQEQGANKQTVLTVYQGINNKVGEFYRINPTNLLFTHY
jgi:hypothetical protein